MEGAVNAVAILQWDQKQGFHVEGLPANALRDRWGHIHARQMHPSCFDAYGLKPSRIGIDYLMPIFGNCIGDDDMEAVRQSLFNPGNLFRPYHSVNTDLAKRIRYLE
jgi:6-phosphofructokinase 1